jgi:formylglycine-generating enzyme required for sulfatase activity
MFGVGNILNRSGFLRRLWRFGAVLAVTLVFAGNGFAQDSTGREITKPAVKKPAEKSDKKPASQPAKSPAKKSSEVRPTPKKPAPVTKLTVTAPPGALIEIDGSVKGFTGVDGNLIVLGVVAGERKLTVTAEGYELWSGSFSMGTASMRYEVSMRRKPEPGKIALIVNEQGVVVIVDEHETIRPAQGQPYLLTGLSTGNHQVRANKPNFREWRGSVSVEPGKTTSVKIELKPLIDPELLLIEEGVFEQGNDNGDKNQRPKHQVFVAAFEISRSEITNQLYKKFVDATGHPPPQGTGYGWHANVYPAGHDNLPVVFVSWDDAVAFCRWLSAETGSKYRLPTEAEWEKAVSNEIISDRFSSIGSVWEWCSDWYDADYYRQRDRVNPQGPLTGKKAKMMGFEGATKSLRGGGFGRGQVLFRARERNHYFPNKSRFDIGFRVVREITK